ncbi:uncharacterized protein LOC109860385 [Pseudomyrmex gracilis]|uniref:uncharacterized protein LOC109860385 n=1 Tax=Pseudomyrmex gracilis TaxID=219809 RepID=UPI000994E9E5|nr:uncharacterized protein LOC109860385 [Pseudomyrmex gracilis]
MYVFKSSIYIILHLYAFFWNVYCDETDVSKDDVPFTEELKNIYSFFYTSKDEDFGAGEQPQKNYQFPLSDVSTEIQPIVCKEWDEKNTQEAIFYKRLISILLSNLFIQRHNDRLIGKLSIEASSLQFEYLQNFVKGQGSIREVDRILDSIIQQPDFSAEQFVAEATYYLTLLKDNLMYYLQFVKEHWNITIISFVVIASFMVLRRQKWSRGLIIFLVFDVIFIISFFITWWQLIQEAEIKLMAAQAQFAEMPITCQPHKMGHWDKMISFLYSTNDCERYYETMMTNPKLKVTPVLVLTHLLSTVIFHPLSSFGTAISEFIKNATGELNFFYKFPVIILLFLSVCICIVLVPLFLLGGSLNFGVGPFFKFGLKGRSKQQERIEQIYENTSSKKRLKNSKKLKQITLEDKDPAGGDTGIDTHLRLQCKHKKQCTCDNEDIDLSTECEKEEQIIDCK